MEKQGGIANAQGRTLESIVINTLEQKGFRKVPYKEYLNGLNIYGDELLLTNVLMKPSTAIRAKPSLRSSRNGTANTGSNVNGNKPPAASMKNILICI